MLDSSVLARQVLLSSSSSRPRSKKVLNQSNFDVPDPLMCLRYSSRMRFSMVMASLILDYLSVLYNTTYIWYIHSLMGLLVDSMFQKRSDG